MQSEAVARRDWFVGAQRGLARQRPEEARRARPGVPRAGTVAILGLAAVAAAGLTAAVVLAPSLYTPFF